MTDQQIKKRALKVIEGSCLLWQSGPAKAKRASVFLGCIFRYAHLALGECKEPHAEWVVELNQIYKAMVKNGVIARQR